DPVKVRHGDDLLHAAQEAAREAFRAKIEYLKDVETKLQGVTRLAEQALAQTMLGVIDEKWKDHLYDLDQLRAAIQYRAWGQKDPLVEYKQEAYDMFVGLMNDIRATFTERWLKLQIELTPPRGGTATGPAGGRPPRGPTGGGWGAASDPVSGPPIRRPSPMVATKPAAEGAVGGAPAVARGAGVGA